MSIETDIFGQAKVDFAKLEKYGFIKHDRTWRYESLFMDGAFKAVVYVDATGAFSGNVYEVEADDIYLPLRVNSMEGFAFEVRKGYEQILQDILLHCCDVYCFSGVQANRICENIAKIYGDNPIFPWDKYSDYGVFKNPNNGKWYALVMNIDYKKIDAGKKGKVEVMNLKLNSEKILDLIQHEGFYPAYHMNKKSWITVLLNDTLSDDVIMGLLDESHAYTVKKAVSKRKP